MYKLQKQAKQIKKELKNIHIEAETDGFKVVVTGEQEFVEVHFPETPLTDPKRAEKALVDAANKAIKKSQSIGAQKMKEVMGPGGLSGLGSS